MLQVEVRSRIVGAQASDTAPNIVLNLLNEKLTVAELIAGAVEEQVRDMLLTQKLDTDKAQTILERQYMTGAEIREQAARGFVRTPTKADLAKVNVPLEIQKAQQAFEKRAVMVLVDGYQAETLEEDITLTAKSKITFLRLTPLAGG